MSTAAQRPIVCPFTVAIDTREQLEYPFKGLISDSKHNNRPLEVPTKRVTLKSGDYSIVTLEDRIAIERKSLADIYSTIGQGIKRFRAEHERLATYQYAAVIIEATTDTVLFHPPKQSRLQPKTILRIATKWGMRYGVHWRFVGIDRQQAMSAITERGLETVAEEVGVAFFRQQSHAERIAKVVEAYRAQQSRDYAQSITFRTLEAFWNLTKEKDKEANERTNDNANGSSKRDTGSTGRGKRIGVDGGRPAKPTGANRPIAGPPTDDDAPF